MPYVDPIKLEKMSPQERAAYIREIQGLVNQVHEVPDGNNGVVDLRDKSVFDISEDEYNAAKNAPVVNNNVSAAASTNGIGNQTGGENPNWNLYDAIVTNPTNTVAVSGPNATQGVNTLTSGAIQQSNGADNNNQNPNATDKKGIDMKNRPGYNAFLESLSFKPESGKTVTINNGVTSLGTEPASEPPVGEATLTTKPEGEGMIKGEAPEPGPNDSVGPNDAKCPNDTPGVNDTDVKEPEADKPPETANQIDKAAAEKEAKEKEEKTQEELIKRSLKPEEEKG